MQYRKKYEGLDVFGRVKMVDGEGNIHHVHTEDVVTSLFGGWSFINA
jgi:hypothetical protein